MRGGQGPPPRWIELPVGAILLLGGAGLIFSIIATPLGIMAFAAGIALLTGDRSDR